MVSLWPYALGAWVASNVGYHAVTMAKVNDANAPVIKPPAPTSIVLCCWRESQDTMKTALESIKNQNVYQAYPNDIELVIIGCTGVDMSLAKQYATKTDCVDGKLSARNRGVSLASGDIIVSIDCDAFVPPNWLNMVLKEFYDPNVIAVETVSVDKIEMLSALFRIPLDLIKAQKLMGRGSAFRKWAFQAIGGFRTDFDQRDAFAMVQIEEYDFYQQLSQLGKIKFVPAPVRHLEGYGGGRGIRP